MAKRLLPGPERRRLAERLPERVDVVGALGIADAAHILQRQPHGRRAVDALHVKLALEPRREQACELLADLRPEDLVAVVPVERARMICLPLQVEGVEQRVERAHEGTRFRRVQLEQLGRRPLVRRCGLLHRRVRRDELGEVLAILILVGERHVRRRPRSRLERPITLLDSLRNLCAVCRLLDVLHRGRARGSIRCELRHLGREHLDFLFGFKQLRLHFGVGEHAPFVAGPQGVQLLELRLEQVDLLECQAEEKMQRRQRKRAMRRAIEVDHGPACDRVEVLHLGLFCALLVVRFLGARKLRRLERE
eukprot:7389634-Prymnesium_polylepis.1